MVKKILFGMVTLGLLSVLLAACTIKDASQISSGVPVHMGAASFIQSSVTIKKGQAVDLIDNGAFTHIIVNGSWVNGKAVPKQEAGAPTVNITYNGNSAPTSLFNTAGTFHLYCTIHQNMNLTVVVK